MSRSQFAGKGVVIWVPDPTGAGTVVSLMAPTAVQINSGVNITGMLRRDGLTTPQSGNTMETSDLGSRTNSTDLGTNGGDKATLKPYRDDVSVKDIAWPLFAGGKRGFLCVARTGIAGATPAAGDKFEIYQCGVINRSPIDPADNTPTYFSSDLSVAAMNQDAVLT